MVTLHLHVYFCNPGTILALIVCQELFTTQNIGYVVGEQDTLELKFFDVTIPIHIFVLEACPKIPCLLTRIVVDSIILYESVERMNCTRYLKIFILILIVQFPTQALVFWLLYLVVVWIYIFICLCAL